MPAWSEQDDAVLRDAVAADKSGSDAAKLLGRSRNACIKRANKLGLTFRGSPQPHYPFVQKKRNPHAPTTPPPVVVAINQVGIPLSELKNGTCKYPLWDGPDEPRLFCGAPCPINEPYCATHRAVCWRGRGDG